MKPDSEYLEFIPNKFPEDYTMRAEIIREGIKAVIAIGLIMFFMFALLWGTP